MGYSERPWARVAIDATREIIAFGTGGKGNFASYWGLDASGAAALLVTDFGALFDPDEAAGEDD